MKFGFKNMNNYGIDLSGVPIEESGTYANYIKSLYEENVDYTLFLYPNLPKHPLVLAFPVHLRRLAAAKFITFEKEEDYLAFKLKFNI